MSGDAREQGKKRLFSVLHDLDEEEEQDILDKGRSSSIAFLKETRQSSERPSTATVCEQAVRRIGKGLMGQLDQGGSLGLRRSLSAPTEHTRRISSELLSITKYVPDTRLPALVSPSMRRSAVDKQVSKPKGNKKKRTEDVQLVTEAQRLFKGLVIFFFPNNDTNVPRRQRIQKSIAYGATWSRDWNDHVTHVVVDNAFNFAHLLDFLKMDALADSVVVVNETYLPDCLTYHYLLDPQLRSYQVSGRAQPLEGPDEAKQSRLDVPNENSTTARSSLQSLKLKPPTKAVLAREPHTPSSVDAESIEYSENFEPENPRSTASRRQSQHITYNDALESMIVTAKALQDFPLDEDEEDHFDRPSSRDSDTDIENSDHSQQPTERLRALGQEKFRCMQKHEVTEKDENPNARTIEVLQKMATHYDGTKDMWRTRAYRQAITTLRKQSRWITSAEEARILPNIGPRLADKIEEIAMTNELRRLDAVTSDPKDQILQRFTKIYDVGIAQASKWVEQGFQTLDDLRSKAKLTPNQEIGLAHYEDFLARIPRDEVTKLAAIVKQAMHRIDPAYEITVGGSYRRGSSDSGDIDLLITKPNASALELHTVLLTQLVPDLEAAAFLKCTLAASSKDSGSKWHGACALPGANMPWRRIDLLLVPWNEMGAALIYFTGNDIFNRSIRLLASTKGMRLNQHGLYRDVLRGKGRQKITEGSLIEGRSERRIFELLGVPWRPPEHRVC